ncbi:branched-chain amino acid ABC transporter permease [Mameliella alba]|nr:branched-chain amino acid ABC transporter permease [Mameliella alba]MCA0956765.1 branched-chain amino acid ABC transporter permease [Mameliella alba]
MLSLQDYTTLFVTGASQGCAYGLIALGFVLIYKATEVVNFAHGEFMMLGAFAAITLTSLFGFWPGLICAVLAVGTVGYLLDAVVMRRIIGQSQTSVFILTVAFGFIFRSIAGMIWGWDLLSLSTPFSGSFDMGSVSLRSDRIAIIVLTVVMCAGLFFFFARSRLGVAMQAASQNQLAAYYMGIPVKRLVSIVWAIGAMIAALAGVFNAPLTQVDTQIGALGLKALAGAVIGGFGSIPGALLGCLLIGVAEPFADYFLPAIKGVSAYILMLVVLFIKPEGLIVQTFQKKV